MTTMICGSLAYDTVMVFNGRFREHILPDRIHTLSVSFLVPQMRRNFGGCAGNIAFSLKLLGLDSHILAAVGEDFDPYETWMRRHGLSLEYVRRVPGAFTAQAFITTDLEDNQITAFHPGAMLHAGELVVPRDAGISLGLVGPDSREAMLNHAQQFAAADIPFIFDVGQGLPLFDGGELARFIDEASWVIVNDYEGQVVQERTGLDAAGIARRCEAYIVTRGAQGSEIHTRDGSVAIPAVAPARVVDPTGAGDAYRAGILYGLTCGLDWPTTGRIASLLGSLKVAHHGTQTHAADVADFTVRFEQAFGYAP